MAGIFIKEVGGVVADAELKWTPQGKAVCRVRLGFSDPVYDDQTQQWSNVNQFWVEADAWERTAEQIAEVATKGTQLLVWGKLTTDQWEDKQTGEKKSKPKLKLKGFRPVGKLPQVEQQQGQGGGFSGGQPQGQQPRNDPWAAPQPAQGGWGTPQQDEVPF